jgi:hypothetical protein
MKTLKLSGFALLFISLFSCTKSSNTLDQTQQTLRTNGNNTPAPQLDVDPGLTVNFNPTPAVLGQEVTVTGTFTGTATPTCGKLQLFQMVNGNWVNVAQADVSSSVQSVSFKFTPTIAGTDVYEFRVHYIAQECRGYNPTFSSNFFLSVEEACHGLTLSATVTKHEPSGDGINYFFTVEYTVNTCSIQYNHLKTQGGLTAFSTDVINLTDGGIKWDAGKSDHPNTIIKWEESSPLQSNSKTYSVTFVKPWSGTGSVQLTGAWSVHADLNGVDAGTATFDPIYYHL